MTPEKADEIAKKLEKLGFVESKESKEKQANEGKAVHTPEPPKKG